VNRGSSLQYEVWFQHPAVQAAVLPFIAALVVAIPLARTRWLGLAQAAGFIACASIAVGWAIEPLTATRKLAFIGAASALLVVAIELAGARSRLVAASVMLALAGGTVWMLWRVLAQKEVGAAVVTGAIASGWMIFQSAAALRVSRDPVRGAAAGAALGWATGIVAILGASGLLGVLALAAGSAAAATLLVQMARNTAPPAGRSISLPAVTVAALAAAAVVLTAELAWYVLLPLLAVVPLAGIAPASLSARARGIAAFALGAAPAAAAVALAWFRPA
jgi:hypothetical protein